MRLEKCPNGHFYDADKYNSCPHCAEAMGGETVSITPDRVDPTLPVGGGVDETQPAVNISPTIPPFVIDPDTRDDKTLSYYHAGKTDAPQDPVVGWLVCVKGAARGKSFCLKAGRNYIGRDKSMDVALTGENTVSRVRHAIVVFEPKAGVFLAQAGESSELFYLNGSVVLTPMEMKKNDRLSIGEVELMLIPCCDENFNWNE